MKNQKLLIFMIIVIDLCVVALLVYAFTHYTTIEVTKDETRTQSPLSPGTSSSETQTEKKVRGLTWEITLANPDITNPDNYKHYEQTITAIVSFEDNTTKVYPIGTAYGCSLTTQTTGIDQVDCYFAASGASFKATLSNGTLRIEKITDDASGETNGTTETVLQIE